MSARFFLWALLALAICGAASAQTAPAPKFSEPHASVATRTARRGFPSAFQAWNPADNLKPEAPIDTAVRHDLIFQSPAFFGLQWNEAREGLASGFTPESIPKARAFRTALQKKNPNVVLLAEIRYRDADSHFLPEDSPWWQRDAMGNRVIGWAKGGLYTLNFEDADYQKRVVAQCRAVLATGVVDGVMLDWWTDDPARLALIRKIRAAVGPDALILVNANDHKIPRSAKYINGVYMECYRTKTKEDWMRIAQTLLWAEANLRAPKLNCLETWYENSRQELNRMRATTCLSLTLSNGYCLFSDSDHQHDWYPFWNRSLGRPVRIGNAQKDGAFRREFQHGTAVYNPPGNGVTVVTFSAPRRSLATGKVARTHPVPELDGDIFLKVPAR